MPADGGELRHAVCTCRLFVLQLLFRAYVAATTHAHTRTHTHTQQQGELALHAACAAKRPTSVLNLLLEWFPEGASVPNNVSVVPSPGCLALAGVGVYQRRGEGGGEK